MREREQRRSGSVTTFVLLRSGESRPGTYPNFYSAVLYLQTLCHSAVIEPGHTGDGIRSRRNAGTESGDRGSESE